MKTVKINLYQFSELSKKAQEKALETFVNTALDFEWWDSVYDDAKTICLKITGFDLDRVCDGQLTTSAAECAELILKNHGKSTDTYKLATEFLKEHAELVEKHSDGHNLNKVAEENEYDYDNEADEQEAEFLKSLLEEYRIMLRKESEYLQSAEAAKEAIEANDYLFFADGETASTTTYTGKTSQSRNN